MNNLFVTSDFHFGHANILTFKKADGSPLREFSSVDEMDEILIENYNRKVKPQDKVYILGDVAFRQEPFLRCVSRLNGHKRLILGNHDKLNLSLYSAHFEKIGIWRQLTIDGVPLVLSHVPIHKRSFRPANAYNIHGHTHSNLVGEEGYINVCVEMTNFEPLDLRELVKTLKPRI